MSGPEKLIEGASSSRTIACAKCGQSNAHHRNVCEACGAHLHVSCQRCGHRNARIEKVCHECGQSLHRNWLRRACRGFSSKHGRLSLLEIVLLLLAILAGIAIIVFLAELRVPPPET
jgi:uncharacterized membrane protein YvbJ